MDESFASTSSTSSVHPNFHQLSHLLISRGFIKHPLQVESLPADHLQVLADLLYELLSQRDQDVEFRETLIGKNRTLESSLDRSNRFLKEEKEKSLNEEKKAMKERAKAESLASTLALEQSSHKAAKEELSKARRELTFLKISSVQSKLASERHSERIRSRLSELTNGNLRGITPEVRILDGHFNSIGSIRSNSNRGSSIESEQIKELEKKREDLLDQNQALKRISTDSINCLKGLDHRLSGMIRLEEEESKNSTAIRKGLRSSTRNSNSDSTSSSNSNLSSELLSLSGPNSIPQRDLFPPSNPLSINQSSASHPATKTLSTLLDSVNSNFKTLQSLEENRRSKTEKSKKDEREQLKEEEFKQELLEEEEKRRKDLEDGKVWGSDEMRKAVRGKGKEKTKPKDQEPEVDHELKRGSEGKLEERKLESLRIRLNETSQKLADTEVLLEEKEEEAVKMKEQAEIAREEFEKEKSELEREREEFQREKEGYEKEKIERQVELAELMNQAEIEKLDRSSKGKGRQIDLEGKEVEMMEVDEAFKSSSRQDQEMFVDAPSSSNQHPSTSNNEGAIKKGKKPRKSRLHSRLISNPLEDGMMEDQVGEGNPETLEKIDALNQAPSHEPQRDTRRSSRLSGDSIPEEFNQGPQRRGPILSEDDVPSGSSSNRAASSLANLPRPRGEEKLSKARRERREAMEKNALLASSSSGPEINNVGSRGIKRRAEVVQQDTRSDSVGSRDEVSASKKQRTVSSPPPTTRKSSSSSSNSTASRTKSKVSSLKNFTNQELNNPSSEVDAEVDSEQKKLLGPRALAKARSDALAKEKAAIASGDLPNNASKTPALSRKLVGGAGGRTNGHSVKGKSGLLNSRKT